MARRLICLAQMIRDSEQRTEALARVKSPLISGRAIIGIIKHIHTCFISFFLIFCKNIERWSAFGEQISHGEMTAAVDGRPHAAEQATCRLRSRGIQKVIWAERPGLLSGCETRAPWVGPFS